ncbi:MAG: TonB-dependent receptor [Woeseiaceae bacterium]|nr:TonB-dependent receptor [Woeseiaceae bacterium]
MKAARAKVIQAVAVLTVAAVSSGAWAQQSTADAVIEEILVTAQKREQSLQEVPISITAFSAATIERAGIREFADYASKTPNVGFSTRGNRSTTKVGIRGVTNIGGKANSVGIYVDEFNIAPNILVTGQSRTADTGLYDVERIEVLRGPQGTFFGRNTMGGAISITTAKPNLTARSGSVKLEVDDFDGYMGRVSLNQPLGDTVGLLFTGYYREVGGFLDNVGPSGTSNDGTEQGGRIALRFNPNSALSIDASMARSDMSQDQQVLVPTGNLASIPSQLVDVVNFFPFLFAPLPTAPIDTTQFPEWPLPVTDAAFYPENFDTIATDTANASESVTDTAIVNISYEFGDNLTLTSVTGWMNNDFDVVGDGDMSIYPAFVVSRTSESTAWSQEFRLASYGNESFDWMVGAIYSDDEITETDLSTHLATDPYLAAWGATLFALAADGGQIDFSDPQIQFALANGLVPAIFGPMTVGNFEDVDRANTTDSIAVFGEATWHLSDAFDLSLGLRWTDDEVTFSEVTRPTVTLPVGSDLETRSFDDISPRITANFFPDDDTTVYVTAAKGYKVGGVNSDVTAALPAVDKIFSEETGYNYEVGIKTDLVGGRIRLNAAAFYFDWEDLQVRSQDVLSQRQFVQNAADATSRGVEVELMIAMTENAEFRLGYGVLDSTFGDFPNAVDLDGDVFDATGNDIPFAPENSISASVDVDIPLQRAFDGYLRFDYSNVGDQFADARNSSSRLIPKHELVNARFGIRSDRYDAAIWVRNLLDEEYVLGYTSLETFLTGAQRVTGAPRQFGATFSWLF